MDFLKAGLWVVAFGAFLGHAQAQDAPPLGPDSDPEVETSLDVDASGENEVLARINSMRNALHLGSLTREEHLDAAARLHSEDMARNGFLDHVSPRTGNPQRRVHDAGVSPRELAENVAQNSSAIAAHEALVASEPHRNNLVNPNYTHVGLSVVRRDDQVYVTEVFARLDDASAQPTAAPVPAAPPLPAPEVATAPEVVPAPSASIEAAPTASSPTTIRVQGSSQAVGYWVYSGGRWWYYPIPANAQPGQHLQPDPNVQGAPPGYSAQPANPPASSVLVTQPPSSGYVYQGYVYTTPPSYVPPPVVYRPRVYVAPPTVYAPAPPTVYAPAPPFGWSPRRHYNRWYWSN